MLSTHIFSFLVCGSNNMPACDQINDSFVALSQCDEQITIKLQLMPKKYIVKIENPFTRKIRLDTKIIKLLFNLHQF